MPWVTADNNPAPKMVFMGFMHTKDDFIHCEINGMQVKLHAEKNQPKRVQII
jgi:hypothetical protein